MIAVKKLSAKDLWTLVLHMIKIGAFTFGGGWSIVAQMEQDFVEKRQWITREQLLDYVSVGRSMPGIMVINVAMIFGYNLAGPLWGFICAFCIALPSLVTMCVVTLCYNQIRDNVYVQKAMMGVRAVVVAIILKALLSLRKSAITEKICYLIVLVAFVLCYFTDLNNIFIILIGALCGILLKGREKA